MRTGIPALVWLILLSLSSCGEEPAKLEPASKPVPRPNPQPHPRATSHDHGSEHADEAAEHEAEPTEHHAETDATDAGPVASPLPTGKPILIDFTRDHCLPCQIMAPWVDELRKKHADRVAVVEINIDRPENKSIGRFFKARSIPTQVYIDAQGREVARHVGLATKPQMERVLKRHGFLEKRK